MKLGNILSGCEYESMAGGWVELEDMAHGKEPSLVLDTEVSKIAYDSRQAGSGALFVAVKGEHLDGHDFIDDAVRRGAAAIVHEKAVTANGLRVASKGKETDPPLVTRHLLPIFVRVNDSRRALACVSNNFYGRPSENLSVIGVTGTNGKTTTSHIIRSILDAWSKKTGLIGTVGYYVGNKYYPALHTTPESPEFQSLLSEMSSSGCDYVVAEVSSHSLAQERVAYTKFVVVVFTNLTRDHLDFHGTMEEYYRAKKSLFTELLSEAGTAVINLDDEWGRRLLDELRAVGGRSGLGRIRRGGQSTVGRQETDIGGRSIISYGMKQEGDVTAADVEDIFPGVALTIEYGGGSYRIASTLLGRPNAYNILAAVSACIAIGIPIDVIQEGVRNAGNVKGRFETVDAGQDFLCIVDYAHSPDALERLILTARELISKNPKSEIRNPKCRIITVFGCGGDRDKGKRALMGGIAAKLSDYAVITSDNPRSEEPSEIINDIVSGIKGDNYLVIPDRREAIIAAIEKAGPGDILLIAGKGHEDYQEIKGVRYRFSDREVAEEAIKRRH